MVRESRKQPNWRYQYRAVTSARAGDLNARRVKYKTLHKNEKFKWTLFFSATNAVFFPGYRLFSECLR